MEKRYSRLFKIEASQSNSLSYIVYRRNFSDIFKKVAEAKIIPGKRLVITYLKILKKSEQKYLEDYFNVFVNLIITQSKNSTLDYTVHRKNSSCEFEQVAIVYLNSGYEIYCISALTPDETAYLENYFRTLLKQKMNK